MFTSTLQPPLRRLSAQDVFFKIQPDQKIKELLTEKVITSLKSTAEETSGAWVLCMHDILTPSLHHNTSCSRSIYFVLIYGRPPSGDIKRFKTFLQIMWCSPSSPAFQTLGAPEAENTQDTAKQEVLSSTEAEQRSIAAELFHWTSRPSGDNVIIRSRGPIQKV